MNTTEAGGPCGYDAGKKIKGRKRHIVTDTACNLLDGLVAPADIHDRGALQSSNYETGSYQAVGWLVS